MQPDTFLRGSPISLEVGGTGLTWGGGAQHSWETLCNPNLEGRLGFQWLKFGFFYPVHIGALGAFSP